MPAPYPQEFRDVVVRVAENREPGVTIEQIAKDFGVHPMTLQRWLQRARRPRRDRPKRRDADHGAGRAVARREQMHPSPRAGERGPPAGDNAAMERFFSLLQKNVLDRQSWGTREELRIAIVAWTERTYHRRRRQTRLDRLTPVDFETIMTKDVALAA